MYANGVVLTGDDAIERGWVHVDGPLIAQVGTGDPPSHDGDLVDLLGGYLLPGFIDVHMHGGDGAQVTTDDPDQIRAAISFHRAHGTTGTLASLVTAPFELMVAAARTISELVQDEPSAFGHILGIHLEGPFLNPLRKGSHDPTHLLEPDVGALRQLLDAGGGKVRVVTFAPELPGGAALLRAIRDGGAVAAVGHTDATYEQAGSAFDAGARVATHLFNGMRAMHHRDPAAAGAALERDSVVCELIMDGYHVHDAALRLAFREAAERVAVITDATPAAGRPDGDFRLGTMPIHARGGEVTLDDGTLAGSSLTMDAAIRHAVAAGVPLPVVARAAAGTPARLLGVADRTGSIAAGKYADLVVMSPELQVRTVVVRGDAVEWPQAPSPTPG